MKLKKISKRLLIFVLLVVLTIIITDNIITLKSKRFIYSDLNLIPKNRVGLVLGTSKYNANGSINGYFKHRMDAAIDLYKIGKIQYLVVSGDNRKKTYNEPQQMKEDLIAGGVPDSVIYLDYAGFRTLDSIVRMEKIFGQTRFTIISQKFHNERAIFIAHQQGLEAYAYNAKDVDKYSGFKTRWREKFARIKVFIDIIINKKPKFLGEKINIG